MHLPDYRGASIVNLMRSIELALGARSCVGAELYPELVALPQERLTRAKNVVLLVIDGLGYDYLTTTGADSALRRHLVARMSSVFPPTTATAVTSFLTGLAPQQHGLTGWHMWLRELGTIAATLRFRPRHGGEALSKARIAPREIYTAEPMFDRLPTETYVVSPETIIESDYNVAHCGVARRCPYKTWPELFSKTAEILRAGGARKFVHAYTYEIDAAAHTFGVASAELASMFQQIDAAYAAFLADIAGTDTLVLAVADHGFVDSPKSASIELADHPQLVETLALPLCGERRVAYCYLRAGAQRAFEHYVATRLAHCAELVPACDAISQGWFGLGEANPRLAERIGDYLLVMKEDYTIKDWVLGEARHLTIGVHGGVSAAEMYVPLVLAQA